MERRRFIPKPPNLESNSMLIRFEDLQIKSLLSIHIHRLKSHKSGNLGFVLADSPETIIRFTWQPFPHAEHPEVGHGLRAKPSHD